MELLLLGKQQLKAQQKRVTDKPIDKIKPRKLNLLHISVAKFSI